MCVEIDAELLCTRHHVVAIDAAREGLVLHLLFDGARVHFENASRRPYESGGGHQTRELVDSEQSLCHPGFARHAAIGGVAEDRLQDVVGPTLLTKDANAMGGMPVRRRVLAIRVALVIEIMNETREPPTFGVFAKLCRVGAHRRFDSEHMLAQRFALRVLVLKRERIFSGRQASRHILNMAHLRSVTIRKQLSSVFPFNVPAVSTMPELSFDTPVTFFVGENGSGKSTLLEGIAVSAGLPTVGSKEVADDQTLAAQGALGRALKLVWNRRAKKGFFLRAEDFFGFTKQLAQLRADMQQRMTEIDEEYRDRSDWAKGLAKGPMASSLADMERRYGVDLDANSHGQSFLRLFQSRFVGGGLYLLDEPEAPLSPQSQLALMAMMMDMIAREGQFIVATHSPILLAFPGARIYSFDRVPIGEVDYASLDHVTLTREFLNAPERFLRHLGHPERSEGSA